MVACVAGRMGGRRVCGGREGNSRPVRRRVPADKVFEDTPRIGRLQGKQTTRDDDDDDDDDEDASRTTQ